MGQCKMLDIYSGLPWCPTMPPCAPWHPGTKRRPTSAEPSAHATCPRPTDIGLCHRDMGRCRMLDIDGGLPCHHGTRAPSDAHHNTTPHVAIHEPSSRRHALSRKN